jgi:hypothetical protein
MYNLVPVARLCGASGKNVGREATTCGAPGACGSPVAPPVPVARLCGASGKNVGREATAATEDCRQFIG